MTQCYSLLCMHKVLTHHTEAHSLSILSVYRNLEQTQRLPSTLSQWAIKIGAQYFNIERAVFTRRMWSYPSFETRNKRGKSLQRTSKLEVHPRWGNSKLGSCVISTHLRTSGVLFKSDLEWRRKMRERKQPTNLTLKWIPRLPALQNGA